MLAQRESTMGKRPKSEVAAIRAKIIASMQSLEEQNFDFDDGKKATPTFDTIMANANIADTHIDPDDLDDRASTIPALHAGAGIARMENDQKRVACRDKATEMILARQPLAKCGT